MSGTSFKVSFTLDENDELKSLNALDLSEQERVLFKKIKAFGFRHRILHCVNKRGKDNAGEVFELPGPVVIVFPFNRKTIGKPWAGWWPTSRSSTPGTTSTSSSAAPPAPWPRIFSSRNMKRWDGQVDQSLFVLRFGS